MVGLVKYYNFPELQNAIAFSIYIIGTVFFVLLLYFITYVFYKAIKTAAKAKAEELEYD
jgi:F0F1-type ATP synthase membrane subunit b/b'